MIAIKINNLNKSYDKKRVVNNLSFEIPENCICGFLGPNGAGKTTTFKLLTNLISRDSGDIEILGEKIDNITQNQNIRFLQDVPEFYNFMSAYEYLKFICELNGIADYDTRIKETLKLVGLSEARNKRIGKFSRGMKQRIGIAASIIPKPKILLLDEPVSALDPFGRIEIFDLLNKLRGKMTIVFSTHIIDDVERVSDKIIIIDKGKKIADGSIADLKNKYLTNLVELKFNSDLDKNKFLKAFDVRDIKMESEKCVLKFKTKTGAIQNDIFKVLSKEKINIAGFNLLAPTLEEIFMEEVSK